MSTSSTESTDPSTSSESASQVSPKPSSPIKYPVKDWLSLLWETVVDHHKKGTLNYYMMVYIPLCHILSVWALFVTIPQCSKETLLWGFLLWPLSGFGITVGVHRLWSHRSFEAHWSFRLMMMLLNSIANQKSIYHWARNHRVHHKHSESDADPHDARKGFFFAHCGWLFIARNPAVYEAGKQMDFSDLLEDWTVAFQYKLDPWFGLYMCFVFPAQVASWGWGESFWNGFMVPGVLRYVAVLHFTWMVNSVAHLWGDHPYDTTEYPAENPFVSFWAIGEGWHSWHHKYPYDYAASEFGITSQFNPSKLWIDAFAALGLVWDRKRATGAWAMGRARRDRDLAAGKVLEKLPLRPWEQVPGTVTVDTKKVE